MDNSLICKLGSYTSMRHNSVRDSESQMMRYADTLRHNLHFCQSIKMILKEKSILLTIQGRTFLQEDCEIAVRKHSLTKDHTITHPTSVLFWEVVAEIYEQHEKEKDKYNQGAIDITKSSFNSLVFTTSSGMVPECTRVNKRLVEKIAEKRREPYASVMTYIRTKLRFALLSSTLAAI